MVTQQQTPVDAGRVAYTFAEFAKKCGRDRGWSYRMAKAGKLRVVTGYGAAMIPASEIERIFGKEVA